MTLEPLQSKAEVLYTKYLDKTLQLELVKIIAFLWFDLGEGLDLLSQPLEDVVAAAAGTAGVQLLACIIENIFAEKNKIHACVWSRLENQKPTDSKTLSIIYCVPWLFLNVTKNHNWVVFISKTLFNRVNISLNRRCWPEKK